MISRHRVSIGAVFSLMVLATTVPLGLFAAALIRASWTQQELMVDRQNIELARAISVAIDQEVDRTIGALTVLSAFIPPASDGYHAFYDVSRRIAPDQQWESVQLVAPPGGVFVATDAPFDAPPSVVNEDWVREVVATHKPVVSRVRKDSALGSWVISIGVPVVRNGAVTSVLGARIHAREFGDILRRQSVPPDGLVTVFDQAPAIVTRTMNEDALVGQGATAEFLARSRDSAEGAWRAKTREGVDSVRGLEPIAADRVDGGVGDSVGGDRRSDAAIVLRDHRGGHRDQHPWPLLRDAAAAAAGRGAAGDRGDGADARAGPADLGAGVVDRGAAGSVGRAARGGRDSQDAPPRTRRAAAVSPSADPAGR